MTHLLLTQLSQLGFHKQEAVATSTVHTPATTADVYNLAADLAFCVECLYSVHARAIHFEMGELWGILRSCQENPVKPSSGKGSWLGWRRQSVHRNLEIRYHAALTLWRRLESYSAAIGMVIKVLGLPGASEDDANRVPLQASEPDSVCSSPKANNSTILQVSDQRSTVEDKVWHTEPSFPPLKYPEDSTVLRPVPNETSATQLADLLKRLQRLEDFSVMKNEWKEVEQEVATFAHLIRSASARQPEIGNFAAGAVAKVAGTTASPDIFADHNFESFRFHNSSADAAQASPALKDSAEKVQSSTEPEATDTKPVVTLVVHHPLCLKHASGGGGHEQPQRVERMLAGIRSLLHPSPSTKRKRKEKEQECEENGNASKKMKLQRDEPTLPAMNYTNEKDDSVPRTDAEEIDSTLILSPQRSISTSSSRSKENSDCSPQSFDSSGPAVPSGSEASASELQPEKATPKIQNELEKTLKEEDSQENGVNSQPPISSGLAFCSEYPLVSESAILEVHSLSYLEKIKRKVAKLDTLSKVTCLSNISKTSLNNAKTFGDNRLSLLSSPRLSLISSPRRSPQISALARLAKSPVPRMNSRPTAQPSRSRVSLFSTTVPSDDTPNTFEAVTPMSLNADNTAPADSTGSTTHDNENKSSESSNDASDDTLSPVEEDDEEYQDTLVNLYSFDAAHYAASAVCTGVDRVLAGACANCFCVVRPPGHHAGEHGLELKALQKECGQGFCVLNNIAIGAKYAQRRHPDVVKKVAIFDFDIHHGNGTEDIFQSDRSVLFISMHQAGDCFYPKTGLEVQTSLDGGRNNIICLPLIKKVNGLAYLSIFDQYVLPALEEFNPDFLFVSAGFDGHKNDKLAECCLSTSDYQELTRRLVEAANRFCEGRLVSVLEGGYDLKSLESCGKAHVTELLKAKWPKVESTHNNSESLRVPAAAFFYNHLNPSANFPSSPSSLASLKVPSDQDAWLKGLGNRNGDVSVNSSSFESTNRTSGRVRKPVDKGFFHQVPSRRGRRQKADENGSKGESEDRDSNGEVLFEVESILDWKWRTYKMTEKLYCIKWKGYSVADNTWEPVSSLQGVLKMVRDFERQKKNAGELEPTPPNRPGRKRKSLQHA